MTEAKAETKTTIDHTGMAGLADQAERAVGSEILEVMDGGKTVAILALRDSRRVEMDVAKAVAGFEKTQGAPMRRRGFYAAADIAGFCCWMDTQCPVDAPVFTAGAEKIAENWKAPKLSLIGIGNYSDGCKAQWHDYGARYNFPTTVAWNVWASRHGVWMTQPEFADFVEARLYEISSPQSGEDLSEAVNRMIEAKGGNSAVAAFAAMLELSRGVKMTVDEQVEVAWDRSSGRATMRYAVEHKGEGGRPLQLPKFFFIRIPVFFGEPESLIGILLNYRSGGGKVSWNYEIFAPDLVVKAAFDRACAAVKSAGRVLFGGSPDLPPGIAGAVTV